MKRRTVLALLTLGFAIPLAGCQASSELKGDKCIVLANGGNKLCGDDAKAWCESTKALRSGGSYGNNELADSKAKSEEACASVQ